jgi:GDPmannose 4,6-dehydratase
MRALISGITGQDGSYLAEFLLKKGYEVHGIVRRSSNFNTQRIDHLHNNPELNGKKFFLHYGDLTDGVSVTNLIQSIEPDEVYNLGAQSHVMVSFSVPEFTAQVDAVGTIRFLEAIRATKREIKFYQASTSELFGSTPPPQSEASEFRPQSPYAAAKLYAYWVTKNYREAYGMHASNGILFNHESPRRGETFVTRKITKGVANIVKGKSKTLSLGNLDAIRDWGYAPEYVESMWMMLQRPNPDDYVIATGVGASVKSFVEEVFLLANLNWQDYVVIEKKYQRPTEVNSLIGNPLYANQILGWRAKTNWRDLAKIMFEHDMKTP